jgi:probable F420-dependent oxidoreductase
MKIGIALPIAEDDDGNMARYAEMRAMALRAEETGFDSVWVYDHLLFRFPEAPTRGTWEAWTILSAVAEATSRVELGALVLCTAFRNPALLAKMADALDEVSGGRLILGLGAGWHEPEFDAFGYPFDHLVSRFEEAMAIIQPLLRTGEVDFSGTYSQTPNAVSRPRGPRADGPPILIGSSGPRMLRLTARYADSWNTCWLGRPTKLAERRAALEAACAEVGRDPATLEVTVGVAVAYPEPGATDQPASDPDKELSGSAEEIAAGLREYAELGVGHVICACSPNTMASLERLAEALAVYRDGGA